MRGCERYTDRVGTDRICSPVGYRDAKKEKLEDKREIW